MRAQLFPAQNMGNRYSTLLLLRWKIEQGQEFVLLVRDQARAANEITAMMPGALCELVGGRGIKIHWPMKRRHHAAPAA